ncbi:MAG: hypothetical protein U9O64_08505 [Campylobacterota bacterium]|nr:hypothetical protein [Campylobacterota bacterium]
MNHLKRIIFLILWIQLFCVSLFASHSIEDMAVKAEYVGVVNITKVENVTVASVRMGWNRRSKNNVSRYSLEIINTIKGDATVGEKLIMDVWQKDYDGKTIKPLSTGEQVLVFLVKFKPLSGAWMLEEQLGYLTPIANFDSRPNDYYYGIRQIKEDGKIDGMEKPYTVSQIKNIINVCNSTKFDELQNRAKLLRGKSQDANALKLFHDAYNMCPTGEVKLNMYFANEKLEEKKLSWQLERAGFPILLLETLFFLLFFAMGYYGKWRWTGMLFMVCIFLFIYLLPRNVPLIAIFSFLLPFISYGLGIFLHKVKKGTLPRDKVKEEIAQSFLEGEDEEGSFVIWEYEKTIFSKMAMITMTTLSLAGTLLLIYDDDTIISVSLIIIPLIFLILILISVMMMVNRLRYRYGCHDKEGYAYGISDSRMKFVSFFSVAIGAADRNATLVGSGLISYGVGSVRREWSSVEWCSYDDDKKIIVISHGCCKSDKLYASDRSYNALKAIVIKAIVEKCTGIK